MAKFKFNVVSTCGATQKETEFNTAYIVTNQGGDNYFYTTEEYKDMIIGEMKYFMQDAYDDEQEMKEEFIEWFEDVTKLDIKDFISEYEYEFIGGDTLTTVYVSENEFYSEDGSKMN